MNASANEVPSYTTSAQTWALQYHLHWTVGGTLDDWTGDSFSNGVQRTQQQAHQQYHHNPLPCKDTTNGGDRRDSGDSIFYFE